MLRVLMITATPILVFVVGLMTAPPAHAQYCPPFTRLERVETTTTEETDAQGNKVLRVRKKPICVPVPQQQMPSTSEQIKRTCKQLDHELNKMAQVNLKVVQLQLDAIGKLLIRVPVAVVLGGPYEATDPPEYVLQEARQTLRRIAELSQRVDELNGKQAWTEEERRWVTDHIYVSNASGNYSVSVSDRTAHGQTVFADLRKMPSFQGCKIDSQGKQFIPQLTRMRN